VQEEEQAVAEGSLNGRKQMFSFRDCVRITAPGGLDTGMIDLTLETFKPFAGIQKKEIKTMNLRVEDRTFESLGRVEALQKLEMLFGVISTNGGMAPGNDGSIANMDSSAQAGPEEGAPPDGSGVAAPAEGVPGAQPLAGEAPTAAQEIQAAAAVRSWLSRPLHTRLGPQAPDLVLSTFRGSQIPCNEWVPTLEKWHNFGTRPMNFEELETFCATIREVRPPAQTIIPGLPRVCVLARSCLGLTMLRMRCGVPCTVPVL